MTALESLDQLVDKLKSLGFNSYEAKVYLALLKHHPATGYEISKASGVPQARAYDTLKSLETNNFVVALGGRPATYSPISPDELLDRWERSFKGTVNYLRDVLPAMGDETVDPVINLRGEDTIFKYAREMIDHAKDTLYLEIWGEDLPKIEASLLKAQERGVDVRIVGYNEVNFQKGTVFQHGHGDLIEKHTEGRWTIISADDAEGLVGTFPNNNRISQGVYTRNGGIVLIIKMLIVHDMFLIDVESNLSTEMEALYGKGLLRLRERILGNNATIGYH